MLDTAIVNGKLDIPKEEYHSDRRHISHSALEVFRRSVPLYHGLYTTGTIPRPEPAEYFELGQAFHTLILEPEKFDAEVAVMPEKFDRCTKDGKKAFEEFAAANKGKALISPEDAAMIRAMRESLLRVKPARMLVEAAGEPEFGIQWKDPESDVPCKARFDRWVTQWTRPIIADLKTTNDAAPAVWAKSVGNFGYHRQQAFYQTGAREALGVTPRFLFVAISKRPPYECSVCELKETAVALGHKQNSKDLCHLRDCLAFDTWESRMAAEVQTIDLPRWSYYED